MKCSVCCYLFIKNILPVRDKSLDGPIRGQRLPLMREEAPATVGPINMTSHILFIAQQKDNFSHLEIKAF